MTFEAKVAMILAVILTVCGVYYAGYSSGSTSVKVAVTKVNDKKTNDLADYSVYIDQGYQKGVQDAKNQHDTDVARIDEYFRLLQLARKSKTSPNSSGPASETRAELSREDYVNLDKIGRECDQVVMQSNALIDLRQKDVEETK